MRKAKPHVWVGVAVTIALMFTLVACQTAPTPNENGVITAEQWKDTYPDVYSTYMMNEKNDDFPSYLTEYPFMVTIYNGFGFAKDYNEARSHLYALVDVRVTERPTVRANCFTCKTPELTALVNRDGKSVYEIPFEELDDKITEPVSCYNCHENTGNQIRVPAGYLNDALGADAGAVKDSTQACGQCHNEYYFDATAGFEVVLPWSGIANMTPDKMLEWQNERGHNDFVHNVSGAGMLKVQHPEFETILGAGSKAPSMGGLGCVDCHMGTTTNAAGEEFTNHYWQSPLRNPELLENTCGPPCHTDLTSEVKAIQSNVKERQTAIGNRLADLHNQIGAVAESKSEDELAELQLLVRNAQWYADWVYAENSYGAHNSTLINDLLSKSEEIMDQAFALL